MARVIMARGTQAAYNAIQVKDANTLYVCTDTNNLYLGDVQVFEANAFQNVSINGKTVTFTTHGAAGTTGTKTLSLSDFATSSEVASAIAAAISSAYKPAGSLAPSEITQALLIDDNLGNVYNISDYFNLVTTVVDQTHDVPASLFVDGVSGNTYPAGTNIVAIEVSSGATKTVKFDILAGWVDLSGYIPKVTSPTAGNIVTVKSDGTIEDSGHALSEYKTKQTAVSDPTVPSSGTNVSINFIDTISQDTNGVITATKKSVRPASSSNSGIMTSSHYTKLAGIESGAQVNVLEGVQVNGSDLSITNKKVDLETYSAYNASTNKIATMAEVTDATLNWTDLEVPSEE